jgi:hypothetical protein
MASYGARNLILATSSVSKALQSDDLLQQLSSYGCTARVEICDVGDFEAVQRLVAVIETPVGGVIHSALKLSVSPLQNNAMYCLLTALSRTGSSKIAPWKTSRRCLGPRSMAR